MNSTISVYHHKLSLHITIRVLATVGGAGRYRPALRISARLLGSNWMRRPAQIEQKFAEYVPIRSYFKLAKS